MKKFIKVVWTLFKVGLFLIGGLVLVGIVLLMIAALKAPKEDRIGYGSVLVFDLNKRITDRPTDEKSEALARLFGNDEGTIQLRAATTALREAAKDNRIVGLYLYGNLETGEYASGYAALKELREAIEDFGKSSKPVIAYIDDADNRDYYLQSVADKILLNPMGMLAFRGMAAQGMFLKGAEDKYGIEFTPTRHGKYKSAIEPFIRKDFSPENREQIDALLKVIWGEMVNTVASSRKITPAQLQALVDKDGLISAQTARDKGLVTELAYEGQALGKLRQVSGKTASDKTFPQVTITRYTHESARRADRREQGRDKIAVVYAEGEIISGDKGQDGEVAGGDFARTIRKLRERKDVKALVLRVNSPGGSGQASEAILDELRRFNAEKPVVVSMGTVAASGGYYISMASRRILAEPNTITGSIGVFGLGLNVQKFANDHGVTFDTVKTGSLADIGTIARPMTDQEQAVIQNLVDHFYGEFLQRVATGRGLKTNEVDAIAQGRLWSGEDALKVGLVDELGGLQKAIDVAAQQASLGTSYAVVEFPEKKPFIEQLGEALSGKEEPLSKSGASGRIVQEIKTEWKWLSGFNDPQGIYTRLPVDLELN